MLNQLIMALLRPYLTRAMRRALRDTLPAGQLAQMIRETWRRYDELEPDLPAEKTLGARIMTQLAAMTAAVYQSLRQVGVTEEQAREQTAQITWLVYEKMSSRDCPHFA